MSESSTQRIEQLAAAAFADVGQHIPARIVPDDCSVESLEQFQAQPARQRAIYTTAFINEFNDFVEDASNEASVVFINDKGNGATAIIDYGTTDNPGWKEHRAIYDPNHTPEYAALNALVQSGGVKQRAITDWLEDFHDVITAYGGEDGETPLPLGQALAAIRRVDIKLGRHTTHTDGDMAASTSSLDTVEAASGDNKLPSSFVVRTAMYEELQSRDIRVRLSLRTGDDKPNFGMRIMGYSRLVNDTAEEIEGRVRDKLTVRVFRGSVR